MRKYAGVLTLFAAAAFGNNVVVSNTNDSGPGSLRNAIATAASGDTIVFNPKAIRLPATITLTSTLYVGPDLTIIGPGASLLFISGGNSVRVLYTDGLVSISGVTVQNGGSSVDGGGILNHGTLTLTNCTLSGNVAYLYGGGIFNEGTLTLSNSTLFGNYVRYSGGGIYNEGGTLTLSKSTLSGNSAAWGGGIFNIQTSSAATVTLTNSTLSGNIAGFLGGGIYNSGGTVTVSNGTLSGGTVAFPPGSGLIYSVGSATLKNTIVAKGTQGGNCSGGAGSFTSLGHNLSDDTTCATFFNQPGDMNSTAAGLDPAGLKNNGGPTPTIALLPTSPAVDAIPVSACTDAYGNPVTTDQRGVRRPQGRACDIGAFELAPIGNGILGFPLLSVQ